ncbi:MAG TPA: SGNH/GDSL hydrolase family protein [Bryocella sp.]|nr:SGNH/GDSL hydrolase family protein [Bryocella sp.]
MRPSFLLVAAAVFSCGSIAATAQTSVSPSQVKQVVAFGDSLTDTGNAYIATFGAVPGPRYAVGEFTNPQVPPGPSGLWIDQFAAKLGVSSSPVLAGGTNFAVGGALTGSASLQDMQNQVNLFLATTFGSAPSNSLYTFWGGADDILGSQNPVTAANNIASEIAQVAGAGGKNFLWFNLPDLGAAPELNTNPAESTLANLASQEFDATWAADLATLEASGINVIGVNIENEFNAILADPTAYGFTNVTTACDITLGCDPNSALFWDDIHPTTYADSLIATLAYDDLTGASPTPEPSSWVLVGSALLACTFLSHRRLRASQRA